MQLTDTGGTTATRYGMARAWWLDVPGMDFDHWGVMAALSTYADKAGTCHPSQATLARRLKRSRPWVNRVIGDLARAGLLRKTARTRSGNPGTTSCEYTLALQPSDLGEPEAPVMLGTSPSRDTDTGRHPGDTTHLETKHNNPARSDARGLGPNADRAQQDGRQPEASCRCPVPENWRPAPEVMAAAQTLAPGFDHEAHATMFAAKSRAKGYLFQAGRADDAWLSWLAEDWVKQDGRGRRAPEGQSGRTRPGGAADAGDRRFASWAKAAAAPRAYPRGCPARSENDNPWK